MPNPRSLAAALLALALGAASAQVPQAEIDALHEALGAPDKGASAARQRLAVKRVVRDGTKLLETHPDAANRFEVLDVLFRAQQRLFSLDDSARNREALLETGKRLAAAPDEYAGLRLDADLLLTQTEAARNGGDSAARLAALMPMVARYRDTPAEARMLQVAMLMALESGDPKVIRDLRAQMAERFAGDLDMISFQRDKLGGQVFGAPVSGLFERADGTTMHLPADALGKTTVLYFWSGKDPADDHLQRLAAAWKEREAEVGERLQILSFNVDELPDAGAKTLRDLGVDWPALHLPGGRDSALYKTFPKRDPYMMTLSPTGYAALIMSGSTRKRVGDDGKTDFNRWFGSSLARDWSRARYINQLNSLFAGDFLVVDPEGDLDPALPPELKATADDPQPLQRTATSVPAESLHAIQACFHRAPLRYRMPVADVLAAYQKAEELCAAAIAAHADAPDLWIVRNRRIVAQLGLWKLTGDQAHLQRAITESKAVLDSNMPQGTDVTARFCLAKQALRQPDVDAEQTIAAMVENLGGENAPGPALATAALLALDVADRGLHDEYRARVLGKHVDHPMMWTMASFMLDREHRYWLFRVPFVAGWSYGRQHQWILSRGHPDEVERHFEAEFQTLDGAPYRLPQDSGGKWTVVLFTESWVDKERTQLPSTVTRYLNPYIEKRGRDDVQVVVAVLGGDAAPIQAYLEEKPLDCQTVLVPEGLAHPLVQRLGILDEDEQPNAVVVRPDGTIAATASGLTMSRSKQQIITNVIDRADEQTVDALLQAGEIDKAKDLIFSVAPPFDPEAVDERGRPLKKPVYNHVHIRARARVYMALKDRAAAQADAEEVVKFLTEKGGWMSMRPEVLDEAENLLESIKTMPGVASR